MTFRVPLKRIAPLFQLAEVAGLKPEDYLAQLDLPDDLAQRDEDFPVELADFYRLQNRLALLLGDETCQMSSRQLMKGSTDFVLASLDHCDTLLEAVQGIARSYNLLHGGTYNRVERRPGLIDYVIDDRDFPYTIGDADYVFFSAECLLIFLHCMIATLSPGFDRSSVKSIAVRRPKETGDTAHLQFWPVAVRYGAQRYRLTYDEAALDQPLSSAIFSQSLSANSVYQTIIAHLQDPAMQAKGLVPRVRVAIGDGIDSQEDLARHLNLSTATLRRRLSDAGTSFRELRQEALNETARDLLSRSHSIDEVAEKLGFAEARSFRRAFKQWNGTTPQEFILAQQSGA